MSVCAVPSGREGGRQAALGGLGSNDFFPRLLRARRASTAGRACAGSEGTGSVVFVVAVKLLFIYFFILRERERERERDQTGEGQRKRQRESQAGPVLLGWSPTWGSNSATPVSPPARFFPRLSLEQGQVSWGLSRSAARTGEFTHLGAPLFPYGWELAHYHPPPSVPLSPWWCR